MLKKHLNSYKGKLSNKQIADGIFLLIEARKQLTSGE